MIKETTEWIQSNYKMLQDKYPNQYIAVFYDRVLAASKDAKEVEESAKKLSKDFLVEYILPGELFVFKI